jgi:IclR family KDG regulon transcriptional repressor
LAGSDARESNPSGLLLTFGNGLQVLEAIAESGPRGLTAADLSRRLGFHKSSLHRLLVTLQQRGYIDRTDDDRYCLGLRVLTLASSLLNDLDLRRIGLPYLRQLSSQVHETVHLVMLDRSQDEVVTLERIEGKSELSLRTRIGSRRPLYCTGVGKAMLAFLEHEVFARVVENGLKEVTAQTITDPGCLASELQNVRMRGYALDDEEYTIGVRCLAAPVFDYRGDVVGAVSVAAPAFRTSIADLVAVADPVTATATQISERLGFRPALSVQRPVAILAD